jgi:hypothetical protein
MTDLEFKVSWDLMHTVFSAFLHILRWKPLNSIVQCTQVSHQASKQCNSFCRRHKDNSMLYKVFFINFLPSAARTANLYKQFYQETLIILYTM